ncbi:MAG TPA: polymer-forming cytoskeletal protein, partial [Gammaproteobacteria bacterium]|nr:polymer-forming cytoskeletal protein [Gammaproteobacteria bacterium]
MLGKSKKAKVADIDTLIGQHTEVEGDVRFKGGLHVNGVIKGNVIAEQDSSSVLVLSEQGRIEGEVRVPHVILNGTVTGDVHAGERIE